MSAGSAEPDFDLAAALAWARPRVPLFAGAVTAVRLEGGQSNPTYRLDAPGGSVVLRRKPFGPLLPSAHAVEREFRVQAALAGSEVPVAPMLALCEDPAVIGAPFYLMRFVEGRRFADPTLPGASTEERGAVYAELARVLAAVHDVDLAAAGLEDFGPSGDYYRRQIARWTKQYRASEPRPIPEMDTLIEWLERAEPPQDGRRTLVHGDMRIDNLLFAPDGPRCVALIDWELSTTGHPLADLAALVMQWRMPPGEEGRGLDGVDRAALGLPSDAAFLDGYCRAAGLPGVERFGFCLAFAFFRMGAILQGVARRAEEGNAADPARARRLGAQVPDFARHGLAAAEG